MLGTFLLNAAGKSCDVHELGADVDHQASPCHNAIAAHSRCIRRLDLRQRIVCKCLFPPCFKASETTAIRSSRPARASGAGQGLHVHGVVVQWPIPASILGAN